MARSRLFFPALIFGFIGLSLTAVRAESQPAPASQPALESASDRDGTSVVIPDVSFDGIPIEDVVEFLRQSSPRFRAMVVRKPNAEDPTVSVKLKSVSVGQIVQLLAGCYGVEVTKVDGPTGSIHVITLPSPPQDPSQPAGPDRPVRVYRLAEIVERLSQEAGAGGSPKQSMENILSLIKATLDLTSARETPTIKYHEETRTLIFKGSLAQQATLEDVLAALETNKALRPGKLPDAAKEQLDEMRAQADRARREAQAAQDILQRRAEDGQVEAMKLRQILMEREAMLAELKARLDVEHANTKKPAQEQK